LVFEICGKKVELRFPESPVFRDPRECVAHRRGTERCAAHAPLLLDGREPGALQHAHVLRDGWERHVESRRDLADRQDASGEAGEDVAPRGVGESGEGVVERPGTVNHVV